MNLEDWLHEAVSEHRPWSNEECAFVLDEDGLWAAACKHFNEDPSQDGTPWSDRFWAWVGAGHSDVA